MPRPVPHDNAPLPWATQTSPPPESVLFSDEREMVRPMATSKGSPRTDHVLRPPFVQPEYRSSRPGAGSAQRSLGIVTTTRAPAREPQHARKGAPLWITAALAFLAVSEAAVIGTLVYVKAPFGSAAITIESAQPGSDVIVDGRSMGVTPLTLTVDSTTKSVRLAAPAAAAIATRSRPGARTGESPPAAAARPAVAPPVVRTGGLRLSSPIDLDVLENGRLLGSSAGPIVMTPGSHQLELVNTTLGYRTREAVVVKTGQTTALAVSVPNGRLSINALPWAEVWIDEKLVGETPLGNVSLPIGAHQIVFRHPQLGERRQSAVVRADAVSRVSVNLQQ